MTERSTPLLPLQAIDVYYSPQQVSHPFTDSPSPGKPAAVVADWLAHQMPIRVIEPVPVTREQLALAHSRHYVDGVLDCRLPNGFDTIQRSVADSLPWTSGSFLSAARGALDNGRVACSPTSGFHHARYDAGWGYCTFNGLMVAARVLKAEGKVAEVGILDCDQHMGDGTSIIIHKLAIGWIRHITASIGYLRQANEFFAILPDLMRTFADCDVLFYQAGADPHIDDPLGGFLTTEQLAERDRIVFSMAHEQGIPVVWNLAGGYQEPISKILEIHRNTMTACIAEYVMQPTPPEP